MALPNVIEIVPLKEPVHAEITVPGSKSITNRALVLAALADGEVILRGALWSEDTQVMVECLQELGFMVNVTNDPEEFCNRTITVYGNGGRVPRGGTFEQPMELFVGNAGTAARFLSAMVCLGNGVYRLHGVPRMHERPQAALFKSLRELGYQVDSENDKLPALIHGAGPKPDASCAVSIEASSQFASALILAGRVGQWKIKITGENAEESPYVRMTSELVKAFPHYGGEFRIEPDASSGSYFWALRLLCPPVANDPLKSIEIVDWPESDWQIDASFPKILADQSAFCRVPNAEVVGIFSDRSNNIHKGKRQLIADEEERRAETRISRRDDLGDSIMTAIVIAPYACNTARFTDLGRLRVQECERVAALRIELKKCGAEVTEEGDALTVRRSQLHGAEIETYNDHRMAMCFGVLGLKVPGIKIQNPSCVKKTFPNFWQKLAAHPPHGLGARILDANTGGELSHDELFAD